MLIAPAPTTPPARLMATCIKTVGDVLMCTPALRRIKEVWPATQIDFIGDPIAGRVLERNPHVDRFLPLPTGGWLQTLRFYNSLRGRYGATIDFHHGPRTALLSFLTFAPLRVGRRKPGRNYAYNRFLPEPPRSEYSAANRLQLLECLGIPTEGCSLQLDFYPDDADRAWAAEQLDRRGVGEGAGPLIAVSPASKGLRKRWAPERFATVLDRLIEEKGAKAIVVVGPGEEPIAEALSAAVKNREALIDDLPMSTLHQLYALLERTNLYLGNDSGIRHLAMAAGLPTVGVFGYIDPANWTPPDNPRHRVLRKATECPEFCMKKKCPHFDCLKWVTEDEVHAAARDLL